MRVAVIGAIVVLWGCRPATWVSGTVAGHAFNAQGATLLRTEPVMPNGFITYLVIWDVSNYCSAAQPVGSQFCPATLDKLRMEILSEAPLGTGTYDVTARVEPSAQVDFERQDSPCNVTSRTADTGSVKVTTSSDTQMDGTFHFTFGSDSLSGAFTASSCPP